MSHASTSRCRHALEILATSRRQHVGTVQPVYTMNTLPGVKKQLPTAYARTPYADADCLGIRIVVTYANRVCRLLLQPRRFNTAIEW